MSQQNQFTDADVEVLERQTVFQGFFKMARLRLRHRLFAGGWSKPIVRELFERDACVGVLLYDPQRSLVGLTEQFRIGVLGARQSPWLFEVVAGMAEPDEDLEDVARREIWEEAGIRAGELIPICDYWTSPGGSSERMYLFCALVDLSNAGGLYGLDHESEDIRLHVLPEDQVFEWFDKGRYNNAATTISLMWLRTNRQRFL
ncbi:NUDIX domain-containing protein [Porticoccus sp.]